MRQLWPAGIVAALILAVWVLTTGALHIDGFLDCCDGLFGGKTPEDRLRIMRNERVGAFAVVGGILLVLTKYAALAGLADPLAARLLALTLGRWGMALAITLFPYRRAEGLGRSIKDNAGWRGFAVASLAVGAGSWWLASANGLAAMAVAGVATLAVASYVLRRLPGLTGGLR